MNIINILLNITTSTQLYAKEWAPTFAPDCMTCVTAEEQTAGKGRFQREWLSPRGLNLYTTFYFKKKGVTLSIANLAQLMAHSLASLLHQEGLQPEIKWPNDLLLHKKKVAGILCELVFQKEWVEVFLGVGVNLNMGQELLNKVSQPATSLKVESGQEWDRDLFLQKLQIQFMQDLAQFEAEGFAPFRPLIESRLAYRGEEIRYFDGKTNWMGICDSITEEGHLRLRLQDGSFQIVTKLESPAN